MDTIVSIIWVKYFKDLRLYINQNKKPVFNKRCPVPFQYEERIKHSIKEMKDDKVMAKIHPDHA